MSKEGGDSPLAGGSRFNDDGFVGLGSVQSLVNKLSLAERKQLSVYLQQHLVKDIISLLPLPLASHLLEFLDAETLCKIRQGITIKKLDFMKIFFFFLFIILNLYLLINLHEEKKNGVYLFIFYLFVCLFISFIDKNDDHTVSFKYLFNVRPI
jgi:hypothetical protein